MDRREERLRESTRTCGRAGVERRPDAGGEAFDIHRHGLSSCAKQPDQRHGQSLVLEPSCLSDAAPAVDALWTAQDSDRCRRAVALL